MGKGQRPGVCRGKIVQAQCSKDAVGRALLQAARRTVCFEERFDEKEDQIAPLDQAEVAYCFGEKEWWKIALLAQCCLGPSLTRPDSSYESCQSTRVSTRSTVGEAARRRGSHCESCSANFVPCQPLEKFSSSLKVNPRQRCPPPCRSTFRSTLLLLRPHRPTNPHRIKTCWSSERRDT